MNNKMVFCTTEELQELVRSAVREATNAAPTTEDFEWLTTEQAAELLGVSSPTVRAIARRDGLKMTLVGKSYRFSREELKQWLRSKAEQPGAHISKHAERLRKAG